MQKQLKKAFGKKFADPSIIMCPSNHQLKMKDSIPTVKQTIVACDICHKDQIDKHLIYFKCESSCNYDICSSCYILHLFGLNTVIEYIKMGVDRNFERVQQGLPIEHISVLSIIQQLKKF
ncbi:UNKNOWN [Stylonychia lemnae]|uniref:KKT2/KKT3 zinc finger domain-containing protein n=1 Tax=Stylonychia lemnae TaxID=5949 RepID=A0A078AGZ5_STYLE|nr:UNKNOWN [Stylonychia lemnae]|eukprot:CDW81499.1 UNKNOWN [Stylonychia lemnae]